MFDISSSILFWFSMISNGFGYQMTSLKLADGTSESVVEFIVSTTFFATVR